MSIMNGISNDCNTNTPYNTTNGGYLSNTNLPTTSDSYTSETILSNHMQDQHAANLQYYLACHQYQFTQPPPPPPPPPMLSAPVAPPPPPPPPSSLQPSQQQQQQQQQQQYYNNYRPTGQFQTENTTPYMQYNPGIPPPTMMNTTSNYDRRAYYQRGGRGGRGGSHNERRKNKLKGVGNVNANNANNNNIHNINNNNISGGGGGASASKSTVAEDPKCKIHVIKRKSRKPMSMDKPNRKWDLEDAKMVLAVEQQHVYKKQLKITFPDEEVTTELVKSYSSQIDYVYFPERSAERYCFLKLNQDADVDEEIKRISSIKFGTSFLKAERKYPSSKKTENSPEDIDPYTLYFGNLPLNISAAILKKLFPTAHIDIGRPDPKKSKRTRYARIRYDNVEDSITAYKKVYNMSIGSRTVNVRFYRRKGVNAVGSGAAAATASATAAANLSEQNTSAPTTANNLTNNTNNIKNLDDSVEENLDENDLPSIVSPIKTETETDNNDLSNRINNNFDISTVLTEIKKERDDEESELSDFSVSSYDEDNNSDYYFDDEFRNDSVTFTGRSATDIKLVDNDFNIIKQEPSP